MTNINDLLKTIENNTKEYEAFINQQRELMKNNAKSLFDKIFEEFEFLEAITWNQWTPYFNDGDSCEFYVYDMYAMGHGWLENDGSTDEESEYLLELNEPWRYDEYKAGQELESYYLESIHRYEDLIRDFGKDRLENLSKALNAISNIPDEIFESFGEGQVIVTRDGIVVEERDHD